MHCTARLDLPLGLPLHIGPTLSATVRASDPSPPSPLICALHSAPRPACGAPAAERSYSRAYRPAFGARAAQRSYSRCDRPSLRSEPAVATDLLTAYHASTCLWGYRCPGVLLSGSYSRCDRPSLRSEPAVATDLCTAQRASTCLWVISDRPGQTM